MEKRTVTPNELVSSLLKIGHGDYSIYKDLGLQAAREIPKILAHTLVWNLHKGEVRDSKVALPVLALRGEFFHENAVSCLCQLDPRNLVKAVRFHKGLGIPVVDGAGSALKEGIRRYIVIRENNYRLWERAVLYHRSSMKTLYTMFHHKPCSWANNILFKKEYPKSSVFWLVKNLKNMPPQEAAGHIIEKKIPFLTVTGAIPNLKENKDVLLALVERMSGSELLNNTNALKKMGALDDKAIKMVYDQKISEIYKDKTVSTLKAKKAAESVGDVGLEKKLTNISEEKLDQLKLEGDWLVLADKSYSMQGGIELAKEVAAIIARAGKGRVFLVFFDSNAFGWEVTGMTLEEIKAKSEGILPGGGTNAGAGIFLAKEQNILVNGIAICSDGGQNVTGHFLNAYRQYEKKMGISPTIYLYRVEGDPDYLTSECEDAQLSFTKHNLGNHIDYYSLPNLVNTMRSNRFTLLDEILGMNLLTFNDI